MKVNGVEGIAEDKAYFLPRGTQDAVTVVDARDIPNAADMLGEQVHFAFRDTTWNEHHQPIEFFKKKGYTVRKVYESNPIQGIRVFLGEATR